MRDRLIELIRQADAMCGSRKQCEGCVGFGKGADCCDYNIADHLLANGVIVPPCKVGDTVYVYGRRFEDDKILPFQITNILITQNKKGVWTKKYRAMWLKDGKTVDAQRNFAFEDIGKTVFLTREEAEQALKGEHNAEIH